MLRTKHVFHKNYRLIQRYDIRDDLLPGYFQILISVHARGCEAVALASQAASVTAAVKVIIGESSQGCRSRGGPGGPGPDVGRSLPVSQPRGQIMPTK